MKNPYFAICVLPSFLRLFLGMAFSLVVLSGCGLVPKAEAESQSQAPKSQSRNITPVDVAIARTGSLQEKREYIGTTRPVREVSLRSQAEGRLLKLNVDVGDRVKQGQILAQLDDDLLETGVTQAQAELAARQSEVARAQAQVNNARTQLERAKVEFQQAQIDAARNAQLGQTGAISRQQVELAIKEARTAQQAVLSAEQQIRTEQQAVAAAQRRVAAQQAIVAQNQERLSYAELTSPINGVVLSKTEPGNLISPGSEVLKLGDFSSVKVEVPLSELDLSDIRLGQPVQVRLDAFEKEQFVGKVSRIYPAADATARQVPVEITIPNSNGKIGSGLLARASFSSTVQPRVLVPLTALQEAQEQGSRVVGAGLEGNMSGKQTTIGQNPPSSDKQGSNPKSNPPNPPFPPLDKGGLEGVGGRQNAKYSQGQVFVVTGDGAQARVKARTVTLGDRGNGQVEILSGLKPGERYVTRSGKPLKDGESVRLSVLSETTQQKSQSR